MSAAAAVRTAVTLKLLCFLILAGAAREDGLRVEPGRLKLQGGWFKTCPAPTRKGKYMTLPPGARCSPSVEWQVCYDGMECLPNDRGPMTCQAQQNAYAPGCTTTYKQGEVCATGTDGPAAGVCCALGLACIVDSLDPSPTAQWKCAVPPFPLPPPASGPQPAAGRIRPRPTPTTTPPTPDVYPGVPDETFFPGEPSSEKCEANIYNGPANYGYDWPCNCYDPKPECFCSPFHGGTNLVPPPLRLAGTKLREATTGRRIMLKGVNWFGFEVGDAFPTATFWEPEGGCHGKDITLIATRLRMLGFNAVRLPFTFQQLEKPLSNYQFRTCMMPTLDEFRADTLDPLVGTAHLPPVPAYQGWKCLQPGTTKYLVRSNFMVPGARGGANADGTSFLVMDRFLWIVQHFAAQGLYTVLDYQPFARDKNNAVELSGEGNAYRTPEVLSAKWRDLIRRFKELPNYAYERYLKGRLLVDIMNEPDLLLCKWDAAADAPRLAGEPVCPPWRDLVNGVVNTLYAEAPETIVIVEGTGQTQDRCNVWGEGFRTRLAPAPGGTTGSSAESWFRTVDKRAPVVLSTHQYCRLTSTPEINSWNCNEAELFDRFDQNFGLKSTGAGYAGKRWPYVFGEIGSGPDPYITDDPTDTPAFDNTDVDFRENEKLCMESMVKYLTTRRTGRNKHQLPIGVFWWTVNWNSGAVNGLFDFLRAYSGPEYATDSLTANIKVKWYKIRWMQRAIGLRPWYVTSARAWPTDDDDDD